MFVDEQIAPADLAVLRRGPDSGGDVTDVDEVEIAVEAALDSTVAEVADHS